MKKAKDPLGGTGYTDDEKKWIIDLCKPNTKPKQLPMMFFGSSMILYNMHKVAFNDFLNKQLELGKITYSQYLSEIIN
jgi:hypothetical protein